MSEPIARSMHNEAEWENFLVQHEETSFLQSWYWGEFHKSYGNEIERTGFYVGDKLAGVMLSVIENARRGRYLIVPGGPIIDWADKSLIKRAVAEMKAIANKYHCNFVRVRPQIEDTPNARTIFSDIGFISAPTHLHAELTSQLDITKSEEILLAGMRKATRYELKKGMALGITVTSTDDPEDIRTFYELQLITSKRQNFVPFPYNFLYQQFKIFTQARKALLYSATYKGQLLAQAFIIFYGQEGAYHYGASTEAGRKYPGAYLIQWEAIKEAKKRNMKRYNFWGVAPESQKRHRFYGLSIFKRGFGGLDFAYLHAQDLVISRPHYLFNLLVESIRRKIRRT